MRSSRGVALLLVLVSAFACAATCFAEGAKPRLHKAVPDDPMSGGVIEVSGTNFSERQEEVSATFGGEPAVVLEVSLERVKILLPPGLKAGKYALMVVVAGEPSNTLDVRVRPESDREKKAAEDAGAFEGGAARLGATKVITLFAPEALTDRGSLVVRAAGEAKLPDGCQIVLALKLDDEIIASTNAIVQSGLFQGAFGPYTRDIFADVYWVDAVFALADQTRSVRKVVKQEYASDPLALEARQRARDRQACRIGSDSEKEQMLAELRQHVGRCLARAREIMTEVEHAFGGAGRSAFRDPGDGKIDEKAWEEWLANKALRIVPEPERPGRVREIREGAARFLDEENRFADAKWREWLDHKLRADVSDLARAHISYKDRFLVVRFPEAMMDLEKLFGLLRTLSENRSQELYVRNNLPIPSQDADRPIPLEDEVIRFSGGKAYPADIERLARKIARHVGLEPTAPEER